MHVEIAVGGAEYNRSEAELDIDEFIQALVEAKEDGAIKVVGLSGNCRGAKYVRLSLPEIEGY